MSKKKALLIFLLSIATTGYAQTITNFAGIYMQPGNTGDNGPAVLAHLEPWDMAFGPDGNLYVIDGWNSVIRKIDTKGIITTVAGTGIEGYTGDGGPATAARIRVIGIACDHSGNIYFCDDYRGVIRKIDRAGIITTIAGTGIWGFSGDGGPALKAQVNPDWLTIDKNGNLYISDQHYRRIRKIDTKGIITTFAGNGINTFTGNDDNVPATASPLAPMGLATDKDGNVYVACASNRIRKINTAGIITTVAGNSLSTYNGDGIQATAASIGHSMDVDIDPEGNIIIASNDGHRIRKVNAAGIITTIAGTGVMGHTGDDGPAVKAQITYPTGIAIDKDGNIYMAEAGSYTVRKIQMCKAAAPSAVIITASVAAVCSGKPVTFTATPVNGGDSPSYQWQVNGKNAGADQSFFTTDQLKAGDKVNCVLTSSIACTEQAVSNSMTIEVDPIPVIDLENEVTILPGTSITLHPQITGAISTWQWLPGTGLSDPAVATPVASPLQSTTYTLTVTSDKGCSAAKSVTVVVYKKIMLPNAFTPNADNKNDVFRIPAGTTFELNNFSIYNRWGGQVFSTKDINEGWDGNINHQPAMTGLYIYSISGTDQHKKIVVKGTVLLLR